MPMVVSFCRFLRVRGLRLMLAGGLLLAGATAQAEEKTEETKVVAASATKVVYTKVDKIGAATFSDIVLKSDVPVLVDFYADWCGPCRSQLPLLDQAAKTLEGARIVKVNIDENPGLAAQYGVRTIPNMVVFKDGKMVRRHVGMANANYVRQLVLSDK